MPTPDREKLRAELEKTGVESVKAKLEIGAYGSWKLKVIEGWLKEKELEENKKSTNNFIDKYKRMSVMKKISLWGSVASIVGLVVTFTSFNAESVNQTTHGNQSPAINETKGDVTINYNNSSNEAKKDYVLRNQKAGSTLIVTEPTFKSATDKSKHVCLAIAGTPIQLLGETSREAGIEMWQKIKIKSGQCAGKEGWAATVNISYE